VPSEQPEPSGSMVSWPESASAYLCDTSDELKGS
jgi:hypothetical protein